MKKKILMMLVLLCAVVQGAWAQASWDEVYAMTNTTSANWTALDAGSTTGQTLGSAGTTTYYYADANLTFSNSTAGGSGLTIQGTVYLYLSQGVTVTCTGANAGGQTGAGAGIELALGNALFLLGEGEVRATGGNAANGGNGGNGSDADWDNSNYWSGTGGTGGHGGGGAGAGIGTRGGQGGNGGAGAASVTSAWSKAGGSSGAAGQAGATAVAMGELYVAQSFGNLTAMGGAAATTSGSAGGAGKSALYDGTGYNYTVAGGGGGGAGGFGGAASNIGTGGPGGGGGGGGASGNLDWSTEPGYYVVKAPGGKGGQNVDGTWAAAGAESIMNHNAIKSGQVKINASGWEYDQYNYDSYVSTQAVGTGGSGGASGAASISEQSITVNMKLPTQDEWDMACQQTNTSQSDWTMLPFGINIGTTLGTPGTTTYYFTTGDRSFTNVNAGGSGLTIQGMVYLYVPEGLTVTCKGADASGATGAGAGIELTQENALTLLGGGTVNATGGNAANGCDGLVGGDANWNNDNIWSGTGGDGGDGGGGAGAGIGTRGGTGGSGGAGAASVVTAYSSAGGGSGADGEAGETAAAMGILYNSEPYVHLTATGGAAATAGGSPGSAGKSCLYDGDSNYFAAGGGGGGAGGFGGAAANIGSGGPGGGGGGGGASGNVGLHSPAYAGYSIVRAPGGFGGQNADGTWAAAGAESILNYHAITNGQVNSNSSGWGNYDSNVCNQAVGCGGNGATTGQACTSGQVVNVTVKLPTQSEWDMVCLQTKTSQSQWSLLPHGTSMGTTIGTAGSDSYYYATGDRMFANANGSGLTILGKVHLYVPKGATLTCKGADASGATGGGAGIELTEGNTLCLIGSGKIVATGGQAANGCNGFKGGDAAYKIAKYVVYYSNWLKSGDGGRGGDGGGGAGAGIGTRGADGGAGGAGGVGKQEFADVTGNVGSNGVGGGTAADMGTLYVYQMAEPTIEAHGGSSGTSGSGGAAGLNAVFRPFSQGSVIDMDPSLIEKRHDGSSGTSSSGAPRRSGDYARGKIYSIGGGGGGGAGGFGGAASDIGTGGPGGGGGGGGASGSITYKDHLTGLSYYQVGAFGGKGGANADGTAAADGEETMINSEKTNVIFDEESYKDYTFLGWYDGIDNRAAGGEGANPGAAARSGSAIIVEAEWPTQGSGTEADPYLISSTDDWNYFASYVNGGMSFIDQYVKLTEDISVTTMASTRIDDNNNKPFSGTFLGNNKTITATIADTGYSGTALFGYINGATIRNLTVAGTIASNHRHMAGLVGFANGTNLIEGCAVTATLNISTDYAGGFVGHGLDSNTTIRGCVFKGTMNSSSNPNVGVIWGWGNDCTPTLENCLEDGTYNSISKMHPMGLQKAAGTMTNCYYVTPQKGAPQNACTVSGAKQAYTAATAPANLGDLVQNYGIVKAYANGILFGGKYYVAPASISLANAADNSTTISNANGYVANVTLAARTLYKDGKWNTLCLPFNVTLAGSPFAGATARPLESASISGTTLNLSFGDAVDELVAGTPYIIKWTKADDYVDDNEHNIVSPVFSGVTIDKTDRSYDTETASLAVTTDERVRFLGTYKSTTFDAEDKSILLLGGENKLYYPAAGAGIGSCRAYFKIGDDGAAAPRLTGFSIDFGDDEATGIISTTNDTNDTNSDAWFTLDGRKLSGKPTAKGLYIVNGKKVIVK